MATLFKLILIAYLVLNVYSYKLNFDLYKLFDQLENDQEQRSMEENSKEEPVEFISYATTKSSLHIGQVGGLATEINGNLVVFHRGSTKWEFDSFGANDRFNVEKYGAVKENAIAHFNPTTFELVKEWGANKFYMPHGLTIDSEQNIWLTDVALHQVIKFDKNNLKTPSLVLGVEFESGKDEKHFCKPTDVAVSSINGDIFVSDGYCNKRVIQFDKNGNFIKEFKDENKPIYVSHSVALIEDLDLVCAADRENGRIVCFNTITAEIETIIKHEKMKRVFAIEYNKETELLHAVSGPSDGERPLGFTFDAAKGSVFGDFLYSWEPKPSNNHFNDPHDVTTSPDGHFIYTGELNGNINVFRLQ